MKTRKPKKAVAAKRTLPTIEERVAALENYARAVAEDFKKLGEVLAAMDTKTVKWSEDVCSDLRNLASNQRTLHHQLVNHIHLIAR